MSGTPPRTPSPDPDIGEDKQGPQELFDVVKVKKLPTAFGQNGTTLCSESPVISSERHLRGVESREDPNDTSSAKIKTPEMEVMRPSMWESYVQCCAICHDITRVIAYLTFTGPLTDCILHVACPNERLREPRDNATIFIVDRITHNTMYDSLLDSPSFRCIAELSV